MKKILVLLLSIVTFSASKADEGMWTLYNLPPAIFQQMQAEGFKLSYNDLYYGKHAVKNAVVNFSGFCSGVVVSADGLVFTNHHCGFEAIRSHSTVEHDYMLNGFYAKSFDEELPNENMFVSFMIEQKDITDDIMSQGFEEMGNMQKHAFLDSLENAMSREVKASDPTLSIEIKPFYEGNKYYATTYRVFNDVRLVFTVPKSMGKFGGDTDNWMWPRQTCDFAVFKSQRALSSGTLGTNLNGRIQGRRLRDDHRLPWNHRALPVIIRHPPTPRCRERAEGAGARRQTSRNAQTHAGQRGGAHQIRLEIRFQRKLLEELHRHEQMHRLHLND